MPNDPAIDAYKVKYVLTGRLASALMGCSGGSYTPVGFANLDVDQQRMALSSAGTTHEQFDRAGGAESSGVSVPDMRYVLLTPNDLFPRTHLLPGSKQPTVTSQMLCTFEPAGFWQKPEDGSLLFLMPNIQTTLRPAGARSESLPTGGAMLAQSNFSFDAPLLTRYEAMKTTRDSQRAAQTEHYLRSTEIGSTPKLDEDQVLFADTWHARFKGIMLFAGGLIGGLSVTAFWEIVAPFLLAILNALGQRKDSWSKTGMTMALEDDKRLPMHTSSLRDSVRDAQRVASYRVAMRYGEDITDLTLIGEGDLPNPEGRLIRLRGSRAFYDVQVHKSGLTLITVDFKTFTS